MTNETLFANLHRNLFAALGALLMGSLFVGAAAGPAHAADMARIAAQR